MTITLVLAAIVAAVFIGTPMIPTKANAQDAPSADTAAETSQTKPDQRSPDHFLPNVDNSVTRRTEPTPQADPPADGQPSDRHAVDGSNVNTNGIRIDPDTHAVVETNVDTNGEVLADGREQKPTPDPVDNHRTRASDQPTDRHAVADSNVDTNGIRIEPDRHQVTDENVDTNGVLLADGRDQKPTPDPVDNHGTRPTDPTPPAPVQPQPAVEATPRPPAYNLPGNPSSGPLYETVYYPDGTRVYLPRSASSGRLPENPESSSIRLDGK